MSQKYSTQNELLMKTMCDFYNKDDNKNIERILPIINGESITSLRLIDWFVTNYSKKFYLYYNLKMQTVFKSDLKYIKIINYV